MNSRMALEAKDKTLKDVLFAGRKFRVPRYQRPYGWQLAEVADFWDDLNGPGEPYFMGSLIFNKENEAAEGYVDIIDGQQRLLTVTILCSVLRDCASKIDLKKAALFQRQDISIEGRDGSEAFRIFPAETISDFFFDNIQKENADILNCNPRTPEESRVRENYSFLSEKVSKELERQSSNDAKLGVLDNLRTKVANLVVIDIEISREEDAYEIFEATNARGLELSVADLLKNLIFKRIPAGPKRDTAKDMWNDITTNVESANSELRKFIRYFWISTYAFVPEKRLFREIKSKIKNWQDLLDDLAESSRWFNQMLEGTEVDFQDLKHGTRIYDALFAIRLMGVSQCYVLFLAILRNFNHLGTDPSRIFSLVEKFSFVYSVICKQPTNRVEKLFSKIAIAIEDAVQGPAKQTPVKVQKAFSELEKELKEMQPPKEAFIRAFCELSYRNTEENRRLLKYVLGKIDGHFAKTDEHRIDFNNVNIEHVLPRKPHKKWGLKRAEIKGYVNLLGNLTLLSRKINSEIQNEIIAVKLPELERSELAITKAFVALLRAEKLAWGESQIRSRQEKLAETAFTDIWSL